MTHERPDLTTIPADAYWPKGTELEQPSYSSHERLVTRAVDDVAESCIECVDVPERLKATIRPLLNSEIDEFPWDAPTICELWANHAGKHIGHFAPSNDHGEWEGAVWAVWDENYPLVLRGMPRCGHSECDHPRDYFCYGCRMPRGHDGRHTGRD